VGGNLATESKFHLTTRYGLLLMSKMEKELKTSYSCVQCKQGFHMSCFKLLHYRAALSTSAPTSIAHLKLPSENETEKPRTVIQMKANKVENEHRKREKERSHKRGNRGKRKQLPIYFWKLLLDCLLYTMRELHSITAAKMPDLFKC
jgi:hypothetical protein